MTTLKDQFLDLIEAFDYSDDVEERIRILRASIGKLGNLFYGTEKEEMYSDQIRRIKLRLRELRERLVEEGEDVRLWRELMDNLEEMKDQVERIAVKEGIVDKY